jgi:hypothetical protein
MTQKTAKLLPDEYVPMTGIKSYWKMPKDVLKEETLSTGAKLLYGVLGGLAGKYGTSYPSKATLRKYLGNPSLATMYRWQQELVNAHLIRVRQKGRGLSNNYYFLKHPLIPESNPTESNERLYAVKDKLTGERVLRTHQQCMSEFVLTLEEWVETQQTETTPFPKAHWPLDRGAYLEIRSWYTNDKSYNSEPEVLPAETE